MAVRACTCFFRLCVAPGGQEHDPPDGVLGGGQAPAVGAVGRLRRRLGGHSRGGRRRPRGAVAAGARGARGGCPPELVTKGLLDLVSPGGAGGGLPGEVRGLHGRKMRTGGGRLAACACAGREEEGERW